MLCLGNYEADAGGGRASLRGLAYKGKFPRGGMPRLRDVAVGNVGGVHRKPGGSEGSVVAIHGLPHTASHIVDEIEARMLARTCGERLAECKSSRQGYGAGKVGRKLGSRVDLHRSLLVLDLDCAMTAVMGYLDRCPSTADGGGRAATGGETEAQGRHDGDNAPFRLS